jgi:catechol 2,3-dioxygenase-like lactoylglutathione lyase family enzyme
MLHHIDVHVRDIPQTKRLLDGLVPIVGYEPLTVEDDFLSYQRGGGKRPKIVFEQDESHQSGSMRLAFAVATTEEVDKAAAAAAAGGACNIEGPGIHPEYGDYYAVFFEDADGNKFEVCRDDAAVW